MDNDGSGDLPGLAVLENIDGSTAVHYSSVLDNTEGVHLLRSTQRALKNFLAALENKEGSATHSWVAT